MRADVVTIRLVRNQGWPYFTDVGQIVGFFPLPDLGYGVETAEFARTVHALFTGRHELARYLAVNGV